MKQVEFYVILTLLVSALAVSCGHSEPDMYGERTEGLPSDGDNGVSGRPGISDSNSLSHELSDEVWRVSGPDFELRYDRGGVLFSTNSDGSLEITDLDGVDRVNIALGKEGADSLLAGCRIAVNDVALVLREVRLLRHGDSRSWYETTADGYDGRWILCLP